MIYTTAAVDRLCSFVCCYLPSKPSSTAIDRMHPFLYIVIGSLQFEPKFNNCGLAPTVCIFLFSVWTRIKQNKTAFEKLNLFSNSTGQLYLLLLLIERLYPLSVPIEKLIPLSTATSAGHATIILLPVKRQHNKGRRCVELPRQWQRDKLKL